MRNRIHKILFYTFLLSVYGVFFSIESFYNFEGQLNTKAVLEHASRVQKMGEGPHFVRTAPRTTHSLRLNKRFHQADIEPCPVVCVETPVYQIIPRILGRYPDISLPSTFLLHYPLRGPPVVA